MMMIIKKLSTKSDYAYYIINNDEFVFLDNYHKIVIYIKDKKYIYQY